MGIILNEASLIEWLQQVVEERDEAEAQAADFGAKLLKLKERFEKFKVDAREEYMADLREKQALGRQADSLAVDNAALRDELDAANLNVDQITQASNDHYHQYIKVCEELANVQKSNRERIAEWERTLADKQARVDRMTKRVGEQCRALHKATARIEALTDALVHCRRQQGSVLF